VLWSNPNKSECDEWNLLKSHSLRQNEPTAIIINLFQDGPYKNSSWMFMLPQPKWFAYFHCEASQIHHQNWVFNRRGANAVWCGQRVQHQVWERQFIYFISSFIFQEGPIEIKEISSSGESWPRWPYKNFTNIHLTGQNYIEPKQKQ